ncbi:MAG: hypothetical protein AAGD01_10785 [Acidobacteriota bacterium]
MLQGGPSAPRIQRTPLDDPTRFDTVHDGLFVRPLVPAATGQLPWNRAAEARIQREMERHVIAQLSAQPTKLLGTVAARTTQAAAEADAQSADGQLRGHFSMLSTPLTAAQSRAAVVVFQPDFPVGGAPSADFVEQWIDNQLPDRTTVGQYQLVAGSPQRQAFLQALATNSSTFPVAPILRGVRRKLVADGVPAAQIPAYIAAYRRQLMGKSWQWLYNRMASRSGGFHRGGQVFISAGKDPASRMLTLIHEMVHLHTDNAFRDWTAATTGPRVVLEGATEILARQAMTPAQLQRRRASGANYQGRVDILNQRLMPHISMDDLARAVFLGEVWRLEGQSQQSQNQFQQQVGLDPNATRQEEVQQAASAVGFVQEVDAGQRYRYMNLDIGGTHPRPEHETHLRQVILPMLTAQPNLQLRFVGHTSSTGSASFNRRLSRRRAAAFNRFARSLGIAPARLLGASRPSGEGFDQMHADDSTVQGRAFNRRVELFLVRVPVSGSPP